MNDRAAILEKLPLLDECERRGIEFVKTAGGEHYARCPFHDDSSPSFRVNPTTELWFCDPCGFGGSVIDLISRMEGISISDVFKMHSAVEPLPINKNAPYGQGNARNGHVGNGSKPHSREVCSYDYTDESGNPVFQVVRYEPKDFRQRRKGKNGEWVWKLEGIVKPLYNLPKIKEAPFVWIVEGEKDADVLNSAGMVATTNAGGAKKWEDQYTDSLRGKEVIICGDNDAPGREHVKMLQDLLKDAALSIRTITIPLPYKDVSDFVNSFAKPVEGVSRLVEIASNTEPVHKGSLIPVLTMDELERRYEKYAQASSAVSLNLAHWLPTFAWAARPLVPGELMCIIMDTGVGKTMALQNIAINAHLPTLLFEMELPDTLTFERFAGMVTKTPGKQVYSKYYEKGKVDWRKDRRLDNISVCAQSRITPPDIERIINGCAIKTNQRPVVVMIDYVQLIRGCGKSRYENMSTVAEELKVIAKETQTIIIIASQIARKEGDEVGIHDAKDSGSIENSSGLVLGAWRDPQDKDRLRIKVLKNTKGNAGRIINCRILDSLLIHEETNQSEHSI